MFKFCLIAMLLMFTNVDMQLEEDDYFDSLFTGTSTTNSTTEGKKFLKYLQKKFKIVVFFKIKNKIHR